MQTTSALYKQILADPEHVKEWRVKIGDLIFDKTNTVSIRRSSALYGKQLIGGACSGSLELEILQSTAHWWRKSKVLYAEFAEEYTEYVDEEVVEQGITLYKKLKAEEDWPWGYLVTPYDGITVPVSEVNDAIQRGYVYAGTPNFVNKVSSIYYDENEEWWMQTYAPNPFISETPEESYIPIEGDFLEELSAASADAYPTYGQSGGFWYSYDGERAATIPEMARIELSVRLVSDLGTSEYLPMGAYWIDRRKNDQEDGTLTLECVDGMMFGEQEFYPAGSMITGWTNKTMREVAQMCSTKMGISLEDATQFRNAAPYILTAPPIGYSIRQVLAGIAAAHGGNIIVTIENKLRLVPFVPTNSGVDLGQNAASLETGKQYEAFGNVVFCFDGADGEEVIVRYPTTEASGATIEAPLQAITDSGYARTIAQNVLTALGSYHYAPYRAADALLDPAMELGDGITINGLYSVIAAADDICDELYSADIGAESFEEIKHEFVFEPSLEKTVARKIAQSSASLKINIDAIIAQVTDGQGNYTALTLRSDGLHVGNAQGTVTIGSGSIHIPNGAITFGDGTLNGALQAAYNNTGGGDPNPSYIHNTYISQTKVISPHIYGGDLYATGQGNTSGTNPAFYMSDGVTGSGGNTTPNAPRGWLCYDKNGAGTTQEAQNRIFLHSVDGVAMKIEAGGNMSLEANDTIHLLSSIRLRNRILYGTAAQRDAITPENGQIFWVVS